jgi:hypothetical protein
MPEPWISSWTRVWHDWLSYSIPIPHLPLRKPCGKTIQITCTTNPNGDLIWAGKAKKQTVKRRSH